VTVRTHQIPLTGTPRALEVRNPAGSVTVEARPDATEVVVTVEALDGAAEQVLDRVDLFVTASKVQVTVPERRLARTPSFAIEVVLPPDAPVTVAVASADATLRGRLGRVVLTGASGDLVADHTAEVQVRSASGDVRIGRADGPATVATASGDVRLDSAGGPVEVRTASGDVVLGSAAVDVTARTASGDVRIERASSGTVRVTTVSGDTTVAVERGLRVWLDVQSVSGRLVSELDDEEPGRGDGGAPLSLLLKSVSGDLRLRRAVPLPPTPPAPPAAPSAPMPASAPDAPTPPAAPTY